jgi:alpha-L-rhamnosidase
VHSGGIMTPIRSSLALLLLLVAVRPGWAEVVPGALRCEYRVNPLGIDEARPCLSWELSSRRRGERQTAYQIRVASRREALAGGRADLWDSGKVASAKTAHVAYGGRALASEQECWWQVRAWDRDGKPSPYSAPGRWTMGLLRPEEWTARWISLPAVASRPMTEEQQQWRGLFWVWAPGADAAQGAPAAGTREAGRRYFRWQGVIEPRFIVTRARFLITADDQFVLMVNGREAGKSDGEPDAWRRPRTLDVTDFLVPGTNVLAIAATNSSPGPAGLAGRLRVEFEAGMPQEVAIDANWRVSSAPEPGWLTAAFDDSGWARARRVAPVGEGPWGELAGGGRARPLVLPPSPFLRKEFHARGAVRRATLYATALGLYELRLNGRRVGDAVFTPGWTDYRKRLYYQSYDVTRQIRPGGNALGAILADGWGGGYVGLGGRDRYGLGRPRLRAQLHLEYADGTRETVRTDATWKGAEGPIREADLLMGESYDARLAMPGWDTSGFGEQNWHQVTEDALPADVTPVLQWHPGVPVRRVMTLPVQKRTEPRPGVFVFDLGQNMVGWARLAASGPAGTTVRLRFAEVLNPDGTLYTANLRGARATDSYTLRGGKREVWEPRFTFHGFRYVEVTGYPGRPSQDAISGVVVASDTPPAGTFTCSSPMVNRLQQNIEWGQRGNFLEVPTDCPQRDERLGWTGDAQVFARTATYNRDVAAFLTKWIIDLEDAQRPDGAFTDVAPAVAAGAGTAGWGDAGVIIPWTLYQVYGDTRVIARHYDALARWIAYLEAHSDGLLRPARGYGDWVAVGSRTPTDVIATAYFAYSTALVAKMARAIGREADARRFEALFGRVRDAFNHAYVTPDGRVQGDTQTVYVLALQMDLLPKALRPAAVRRLVEDIQRRDGHLSTGFLGTPYLLPVLTRFGETDVAYRLLLQETFPSWGYQVKNGATTIWERWDGIRPEGGFQDPGMNSFNHFAFGAVGEWLYRTVAGIDLDPAHPGFRHVVIRPRPGPGLTWARATYRSIHGPIESAWKREEGRLTLTVTLPANTTGTIHVPAASVRAVSESGRPAAFAPGLRYQGQAAGCAVFAAGSGTYRFVSEGA